MADDVCCICQMVMAPVTSSGTQRRRLVCCGNEICTICCTDLKQRVESMEAKAKAVWPGWEEGRPAPSSDAEDVLREAFALHSVANRCPYCKAPTPRTHDKAVPQVLKHATAGKAWAMAYLGHAYTHGLGVPRDAHAAVEWLQKAACASGPQD